MFTKRKTLAIILLVVFLVALSAPAAFAANNAGPSAASPSADELGNKITKLVQDIGKPLGAAVIFATLVFAFFRLAVTANNPQERAKTIQSLGYIVVAGVGIGGAMFLAGFIMGLGNSLQ